MKKLMGWLCALLLIVTPVFYALSEEETAVSQNERLAVFYLHATKDNTLIRTARYVILALDANKAGREIQIERVDNSKDSAVYKDAGKKTLDSLMSKSDKTSDGSDTIKNTKLVDELAKSKSDVWMIVPGQDACQALMKNEEMMGQFKKILGNEQSQVHLVMIGDNLKEPENNTALGKLAAEYPGRLEWIRIASDFLKQNCDMNDDGTIHTGDYFLASLFGVPADLIPDTAEDGEWTLNLPESGEIFILQRYKEDPSDKTVLKDNQNRPFEKKISLDLPYQKKDDVHYAGMLATNLPAGTYTLSGCTDDTKVYWYPDFENLQPEFSMGEDNWTWGSQYVTLSLGNALYRPEKFNVFFSVTKNNGDSTNAGPKYNEETKNWKWEIKTEINDTQIMAVPSAKVYMEDGNLIWTWQGESQVRQLQSAGISIKDEALNETILYFTDDNNGSYTGKWSDYFNYNPVENPQFSVKPDELMNGRVECNQNSEGDGFTLSVSPGEPGEGVVTIRCEDVPHQLKIIWRNAQELFDSVEIVPPAEETVPVGQEVELTANISNEIIRDWREAKSQLGEIIPDPETLEINGWLDQETAPEDRQDSAFEWTEEKGSVQLSISVPDSYSTGDVSLWYSIAAEGTNNPEIKKGSFPLHITNNAPELAEEIKNQTDISLGGMPGNYTPKNILQEALGTDDLFGLFKDEETGIRKVNISITGADGLKMDDSVSNETEKWEKELSDPNEKLNIQVEKAGDYTIALTASDGVNSSETVSVDVYVYSQFLRIAMFAAAGITALILLLVLILVIRQIRKPQFADIRLRCLVSSDENMEKGREILTKCTPVSMSHFGKRPVSLTDLFILTRQPYPGPELIGVTDDIMLLPTRYGEVNVVFGKKAMERIGRHEKKDLITQNSICRLRIDNQYIQVENVQ